MVPQTDLDEVKKKINEKEHPKTNLPEKQQEPGSVLYDQVKECNESKENCKAKRVINDVGFDKLKIQVLEFIKKQLNNTNPKVLITLKGFF